MVMAEHCIVEISIYRAVLFDMDGVVADTTPLHAEAWRRAFEPYGARIEKMDIFLREGMATQAMCRALATAKGLNLSEEQFDKIIQEKTAIFNSMAGDIVAFNGVAETIRMLRNNGLKTALVTGTRRSSAQTVIRKIGLEGAFDAIVTADDVERGKPDPEPYQKAMKMLDLAPLNCIVIENAPLGIESAKAAKVDYVIGVTTTLPEKYLEKADDIMASVSDLEQCLARRFASRPGRVVM